jgi:hypothetical protein
VVYGAAVPRAGAVNSIVVSPSIISIPQARDRGGVLADDTGAALLRAFSGGPAEMSAGRAAPSLASFVADSSSVDDGAEDLYCGLTASGKNRLRSRWSAFLVCGVISRGTSSHVLRSGNCFGVSVRFRLY